MTPKPPTITICIPHWQVKPLISLCLRSIRKHSKNYDIEVVVVDNGSKDESLDYLRSMKWIYLIERPEETHTNWPSNIWTAWDLGIRQAAGDYFITMHSDVIVKRDDWLDPFLSRIATRDEVAGVGAWKLSLEPRIYSFQKHIWGSVRTYLKYLLGRKKPTTWGQGHYPRDYCAMYRRELILAHDLTFSPIFKVGGGYSIAKQLWNLGYKTSMIPVSELSQKIVHIAHGTAAIAPEKSLNRKGSQIRLERRLQQLLREPWVDALQKAQWLDL